jgi:hypothetical protein
MSTNLPAQIRAVNNAHNYANQLFPILREVFAPLVGTKILKATGELTEKVKKNIPVLPNSVPLLVYRHTSEYSLVYYVKTCEHIPEFSCVYHEVPVFIGDLRDGILVKLNDNFQNYRSDFTEKEILEKRENFREAEKKFNEARSALYPFGER